MFYREMPDSWRIVDCTLLEFYWFDLRHSGFMYEQIAG